MENPLQNIVFKSITLKTVHGRKIFHSWKESEKLIHEKRYDNQGLNPENGGSGGKSKVFKM